MYWYSTVLVFKKDSPGVMKLPKQGRDVKVIDQSSKKHITLIS